MPKRKNNATEDATETTFVRTLSLMGIMGGGAEGMVDVKNGRIVRVRPLHYDWKYTKEELNPWKFEKNGKTLEPLMKSSTSPFSVWLIKNGLFSQQD